MSARRGVTVLTGAGRAGGIAAGIALALAEDGWDLLLPVWPEYDARLGIGGGAADTEGLAEQVRGSGARVRLLEADLADPASPQRIIAAAAGLGGPIALVLSHSESIDGSILDTDLESWDRHFAVNARAAWLLIRALAERLPTGPTTAATGHVVALTSDHTAFNLPYGASKGALDRVVIAAAVELGARGLRANLIDPGPIDTGWMTEDIRSAVRAQTPLGRLGTPADIADLTRFLLSEHGTWITGQHLYASGGFHTPTT